jgi:F-type H+-transporting ATPase subunit epsilon
MADALPTKISLTVDEVVLPASDGEIGVLPGHTPLLTTLRVGTLRYRAGATVERIVIVWGFAEVLPDRVIVLAERGVLPSEINVTAAEAERAEAEKELAYLSSHDPQFVIVEGRLEEAVALISINRE